MRVPAFTGAKLHRGSEDANWRHPIPCHIRRHTSSLHTLVYFAEMIADDPHLASYCPAHRDLYGSCGYVRRQTASPLQSRGFNAPCLLRAFSPNVVHECSLSASLSRGSQHAAREALAALAVAPTVPRQSDRERHYEYCYVRLPSSCSDVLVFLHMTGTSRSAVRTICTKRSPPRIRGH